MSNIYYILNNIDEVIPVDLMVWANWFELNHNTPRRIIKQTRFGRYFISTVFIGIDHADIFHHEEKNGKPLVFETMLFEDDVSDIEILHASSKNEALYNHEKLISKYSINVN